MKRLKPVSFKATFVDRRGSRRQDISLSLDRRTNVGATPDTNTNNSAELPVSSLHDYHLADLSETGDFQHSVSAHENRRIQEQIKWNEFRDRIVDVAIEDSYLPNCSCVWCHKTTAVVKCSYCGPKAFLCLECARNLHSTINSYHVLELWKVHVQYYNVSL